MRSVRFRVTSSISSRAIRLRSRAGVAGSDQRAGKSAASWRIRVLCCSVELRVRGGGVAVVVVLGGLERAELVVPVGFEGVGDEPVVGVDGEVAAARELGVMPGALDMTCCGAGRLRRRAASSSAWTVSATSKRERGDSVEQQLADRLIDTLAGDRLALRGVLLDVLADASVVRDERARRWW